MKRLTLIPLLLGLSQAQILCDDYFGCTGKHLFKGQSIRVTEEMPHFTMFRSTGSIESETFSNLQHIEALYIEASNITEIEDGVLCSLPHLKELHLTLNPNFPTLTRGLFKDCSKLATLSISGQAIEEDALEDMFSLEVLTIASTNFPQSACSSSRLKTLKIIEVKNLNLTRNHLRECSSLTEIEVIDIGGITDNAFTDLTKLVGIDIYKVPMPSVTANHFRGLTSLKYLALDDCGIEYLPYEAFDTLLNLEYLSVTFAKFSLSWRHLYSVRNLKNLVLKQRTDVGLLNYWHDFSSLVSLTIEVNDLSLVNIRRIRENLPGLKDLIFFGSASICRDQEVINRIKFFNSATFNVRLEDGAAKTGFC